MLGVALLGVVGVICPQTGEKLALTPEPGTRVTKTYESALRLELEGVETRLLEDGKEQEAPAAPDVEVRIISRERFVFTDEYVSLAEGRATRLDRRFDELRVTETETFTVSKQEQTDQSVGSSRFVGSTVSFTWDEGARAYDVGFVGEPTSEVRLAGLEADTDLTELLPDEEVVVGDSWAVPLDAYYLIANPSGDTRVEFVGVGVGPENDQLRRQYRDNLEGALVATLSAVEDGRATIAVRGEVSTRTSVDGPPPAWAPEDGRAREELTLRCELAGELVWDLEAGHAFSFRWEGPIEYLATTIQSGSRDGVVTEASESRRLGGTVDLVVTFARELEAVRAIGMAVDRALAAGEPDAARDALTRAIPLLRGLPPATPGALVEVEELDRSATRLRSPQVLLATREWIVAHLELDPGQAGLDDARLRLAAVRMAVGDDTGALELFEAVLAVRERQLEAEDPALLRLQATIITPRARSGDIEGALELAEHVHAVLERLLDDGHLSLVAARIHVAVLRRKVGDRAGANELFRQVHETWSSRAETDPVDLDTLLMVAEAYKEVGDLSGALAIVEAVHATRVQELPPGHPELLVIKQLLAMRRDDAGQYAGARELFEEVYTTHRERLGPDHPLALADLLHLGRTTRDLGDLLGALELFETLHAARRRTLAPGDRDLVLAKQYLAGTKSLLGDLEGALELEAETLAAWERLLEPNDGVLLRAKVNLARTRRELGDFQGAHELFAQVLAVAESDPAGDEAVILLARTGLAITSYLLGDLDRAHEILSRVHAIRARTLAPDHPDRLGTEINLALTMGARGDVQGALALYRHVYETCVLSDLRFLHLLLVQGSLATTLALVGDHAEAAELVPPLVAEMIERVRPGRAVSGREARAGAEGLTPGLTMVLFASGSEPALAPSLFELIETRRYASAGASLLGSAAASPVGTELAAVRSRLGDLVSAGPDAARSDAARYESISALTARREELERRFAEWLGERGAFTGTVAPARLAPLLEEGDVAVGFLRYERLEPDPDTGWFGPRVPHLLALALHPDGRVDRIELGPADHLEELVASWRAAVGKPLLRGEPPGVPAGAADEKSAGALLRAAILDPLPAAKRLYVCVDDMLHLVPLDALVMDDGSRFGDHCVVRNEIAFVRLLHDPGPVPGGSGLLVAGDIDFDAPLAGGGAAAGAEPVIAALEAGGSTPFGLWGPLWGTKGELEAVQGIFGRAFPDVPTQVLARDAATKEALASGVVGKRHVHVATHGWFAPEQIQAWGQSTEARPHGLTLEEKLVGFAPLTLSGLCLAGANHLRNEEGRVPGLMTAEELAGLDLSLCDLAVLSACETNVGIRRAGLGIQSLQTALHAAGARTAITSLWRVDDTLTKELMIELYTNLWQRGLGKADALWEAKRTMRKRGRPVSAWAGWILTGAAD